MESKTALQGKLLKIFEEDLGGNDQLAIKRYLQAIVSKVDDCRVATKIAKNLLETEQRKNIINKEEIASLKIQLKSLLAVRNKYGNELTVLRCENEEWQRQVAAANAEICKFKAWAAAKGYSVDFEMTARSVKK